jgi:octaprenyl-diphosphate synthase
MDHSSQPTEDLIHLLQPVVPAMEALDRLLLAQVEEFEADIREPVRYALQFSGKRLRPLMLFYAAGLAQKEQTLNSNQFEEVVRAAAVIEMIHLATLVHDDILDRAELRRQMPTLEKKFGLEVAVLLGDALFAHALRLASDFPTVSVCRTVSLATRRVCAGEISQSFSRGSVFLSQETYFRHIELKTAELFAASGFLGAELSGGSPVWCQALYAFCQKLGTAYQIYDDLADILSAENEVGKTLGTDLASGKLTLPVILLLQTVDADQRPSLVLELRSMANQPKGIRSRLQDSGSLEKAVGVFHGLLTEAEDLLKSFVDEDAQASCLLLSGLLRSRLATLPGLEHS